MADDDIWDGRFVDEILTPVETTDGINYGYIENYNLPCIYIKKKNISDTLPVIIDLVKPVFGLTSVGVFHTKKYIIYRPYTSIDGNTWYEEERISDMSENNITYALKRQRRAIIAFRYLLGLPNINDKNILVRNNSLIDFNDSNNKIDSDNEKLRLKVINDNFVEQEIWETVKLMIYRKEAKNIQENLFIIREEIEKIVLKIDKKKISFVSSLIEKVSDLIDLNNK